MNRLCWVVCAVCAFIANRLPAVERPLISGIYPHLAMFNEENECGTGAVVPWAERLWVLTYAPHKPEGSTDKLYEITPALEQIIRPESIGGTPANRMIHRESQQLFIGPYAIGADRTVRVIPYQRLFGRPTGLARHLSDPANKIVLATMEEGIYEVDVKSLAVTELWADEQRQTGRKANLPGYHGKGFYSAQGRYVYANNGDHATAALTDPTVPSGVLAEWDGQADHWTVVRRNQFTEVTGPGDITGNSPGDDRLWSIGWDHRSLILMLLDGSQWHAFRLPKTSHCYDGAHGWNTEWPRIRDIGEKDLLMTMHGAFWRFPKTFSATNTAGLAPRASYLKVIGDFCRWQDRLVLGGDDTAKNEFLNRRRAKGTLAAPKSQSNLWFIDPNQLDHLGPVIGRGGVWVTEDVPADTTSEPFLLQGYARRGLHLAQQGETAATFVLEVDERGNGNWTKSRAVTVPARGYRWLELSENGVWMRLRSPRPLTKATAWFQLSNPDSRSTQPDAMFNGLAGPEERNVTGGLVRALDGEKRTLAFAALAPGTNGPVDIGYYELDADLKLQLVNDATLMVAAKRQTAIPTGVLAADAASVIYTDDNGKRWRLPKSDAAFDLDGPFGRSRVDREVATERDLFNAHGTFYELPAENAGGFAKVRPVATHNLRIHDYCSYRGLFIMTGISDRAPAGNPHIIRSNDGKAALWAGAIDDAWKLGKPRGRGGPWQDSVVKAGVPSDAFLATGYDQKRVMVSHTSKEPVTFRLEADVCGTGVWTEVIQLSVPPGKPLEHRFPDAFGAYWFRLTSEKDSTATATFVYE